MLVSSQSSNFCIGIRSCQDARFEGAGPSHQKLLLEIDGAQHMEAIEYDLRRTNYLESRGYRVLRTWNHDIFKNMQAVMDSVLNLLESVPHPPPSSPAPLPLS